VEAYALFLILASCAGEDTTPCETPDDCAAAEVCEEGSCVPATVPDAAIEVGPDCVDADGDGHGVGGDCLGSDCDDTDPAVHSSATERCDGGDDDCDGSVDEDILELTCGMGACVATAPGCVEGVVGVCIPGVPSSDLCNDVDDDCDGRVDEGIADPFEGAALRPAWVSPAVGSPIAFTIADSFLRVEDAPYADTPSNPPTSWIYEPDVDLGNQIAVASSVGDADFDLLVDIDWASTAPELTLAGVALTNLSDQMELMLGYGDGSSSESGNARVRIRADGTDATYAGLATPSGAASFRAERRAGVLTVFLDGAEVLTAPFTADVQHVAIYAVAHRNGVSTYPFGSFGLDGVQLCH
jgi:hypothetical protein